VHLGRAKQQPAAHEQGTVLIANMPPTKGRAARHKPAPPLSPVVTSTRRCPSLTHADLTCPCLLPPSYDFNSCSNEACWNSTIAPVAAKVPVVVTECGFKVPYAQQLWAWLQQRDISYLAWVWNTWYVRPRTVDC
jgi:hypothetical protein